MTIRFGQREPASFEGDVLVVGVFEFKQAGREPTLKALDKATGGLVKEVCTEKTFTGRQGSTLLLHRPAGLKVRRLLLAGLGPAKNAGPESARRLGGMAARAFDGTEFPRPAVALPDLLFDEAGVRACVEGFLIGPGGIGAYKTEKKGGVKPPADPYRGSFKRLTLVNQAKAGSALRKAASVAVIVADGMIVARRLVNEPGNRLTPRALASEARQQGRAAGLSVTVMGEKQIRDKGFHALLAVSRGSSEPPRFVIMRYRPADRKAAARKPLVLVGKGITFDTGGISIKPSKGLEEMKGDMAGAAAVIGAMAAIGRLKPPRPVIGITPICENMISGEATRPGDVIDTYAGKTIEVINTDAEGRLILADALAYAAELKPEGIVNAATLTGACVVALGHVYAGLMGNNPKWEETVRETATAWGEKVWPLPMDPEYDELVESQIADVSNVGKDHPGAITAAKLLEKFVGDVPWAHLDIAGVEWRKEGKPWVGAGPTGFGVRTFVGLALR